MLSPMRSNPSRRKMSNSRVVPPPSGGWNAGTDLTDMRPDEAIVLDNLIPTDGGVRLRRGKRTHATGLGEPVTSLIHYFMNDGTEKLFGATKGDIYDVSSSAPVNEPVVSDLHSGWWQQQRFSTAGGNFTLIANGVDEMRIFNGTNWTIPAITGVFTQDIINLSSHMSRLWMIEKNSLKAWYLPVGSIGGAATSIDFGTLSKLGGHLVAMASWTRDGGEGLDDVAVFITSKGEAHVYAGSDPSSATTWSRIGTFNIAEPVGYRCTVKTGADVAILTNYGLLPLSTIGGLAQSTQGEVAATNKISNAFQASYQYGHKNKGWQVVEFPQDRLVIVNVPLTEEVDQVQYVMNAANNGRWCRFTGLDANVFEIMNNNLYYGDNDGNVWQYDGDDDNQLPISWRIIHAFTEMGTSNTKTVHRIRPQFFGSPGIAPIVGCRFDYDESIVTLSVTDSTDSADSEWDETKWDESYWAGQMVASSKWHGVTGEGFSVAPYVAGASFESLTYNGTRIIYEIGDSI